MRDTPALLETRDPPAPPPAMAARAPSAPAPAAKESPAPEWLREEVLAAFAYNTPLVI